MRSIGEMARDSGLGVSALRFYDRAGVLVPAWVDPVSGYRWYEPGQLEEARLLARLRRAGMPLADIRLVLAGWSGADTGLVRKLLTAHLRRLERGLSDARGEFSALRALLDQRENVMTSLRTASVRLSVAAPGLAAALDAVRFAASTDPELPMLAGSCSTSRATACTPWPPTGTGWRSRGPLSPGTRGAACRSSCPLRSPARCVRCWTARDPRDSRSTVTA